MNIINSYRFASGGGDGSYDISTGVFTQIALDVIGQDTVPRCMLFNDDGTILYVLGDTGNDINEYALSTNFDISSGTFTQIALSVSAQTTTPMSIIFNDDGTKLYVLGAAAAADNIYEYALSTNFDISSGSFTQIALFVGTQDTSPSDFIFNDDGTKLYMLGDAGNDINEYALSSAFDISSGIFTQIALDVSGQETAPSSMIYNNDGTKLYVMGLIGDDINEYALSSAYDISSGTFTQIALSVSAQEANPTDMIYNNNGTKLYVMGISGRDINEYALS